MRHALLTSLVLVGLATVVLGAQGSASQPAPCAASEHRQFDFWIGQWAVTTPDGQAAGTSRIESVLGGCALLEHWTSARGGGGKSLTLYIAADQQWNQTWVDAAGNRIVFTGGLEGTRMVLGSRSTAAGGKDVRSELSWMPEPGGAVRQVWRQSTDGGATWATTFDGLYRPAGR